MNDAKMVINRAFSEPTATDKAVSELITATRQEVDNNPLSFEEVRTFVCDDRDSPRNPNIDGGPFMDFKTYRVTVECLGIAGKVSE
jgi:hypothetical protein